MNEWTVGLLAFGIGWVIVLLMELGKLIIDEILHKDRLNQNRKIHRRFGENFGDSYILKRQR